MKLVKNAKKSWRWFSVQALGLQGAAAASWMAVPQDMRDAIPAEWLAVGGVALAFLGVIGRLVDQGGGE